LIIATAVASGDASGATAAVTASSPVLSVSVDTADAGDGSILRAASIDRRPSGAGCAAAVSSALALG
jgi:hypothetical protein